MDIHLIWTTENVHRQILKPILARPQRQLRGTDDRKWTESGLQTPARSIKRRRSNRRMTVNTYRACTTESGQKAGSETNSINRGQAIYR